MSNAPNRKAGAVVASFKSKIAPWWLILLGLTLPTIITYIYFYVLSGQPQTIQAIGMSVCKLVQFGLPVFWLIVIRKWNNAWRKPNGDGILLSLTFGIVIFVAAYLLHRFWLQHTAPMQNAMVEINSKVAEMGLDSAFRFVAFSAFYTLVHSLLEEYYWRWFVFGMLRERIPLTAAIVVSSVGFMAHHVLVLARYFGPFSISTWLLSLCVAIGGAMWAWQYHQTQRLYAPWLSHAIVDAAIFTIGLSMLENV